MIGRSFISVVLLAMATVAIATDMPVDFDRDIRPILSDNCFHCHGPDGAQRQAGLRLDTPDFKSAASDDGPYIDTDNPDMSVLLKRILSDDPNIQMPPLEAKKVIEPNEKALIRQWIAEGAEWSTHWSLVAPMKPTPPSISNTSWARNPIDQFIAARLERESLTPSYEANRETLIRRLSLDLTGLPPTPDEVSAFLLDNSPDAYERLVDRLLASPHYGERMAWPWLDAARYADTNGYQGDGERTMYPWRDWVVDAFNENMPFDQFTVWQIAGDLLPDATHEQKLATGFNRNHMINGEGGRIAEENRIEYIFDQIETVGTVWMGLTFNCCRCHDHKYDPLTNANYFELFAYFNQTPVDGAGGNPKTPPNLAIFSDDQRGEIAEITAAKAKTAAKLAARRAELRPLQTDWEQEKRAEIAAYGGEWSVPEIVNTQAEHQTLTVHEDGAILALGDNPNNDTYRIEVKSSLEEIRSIRLEAIRHPEMTEGGLSRSGSGNFVLTDFRVAVVAGDTETEAVITRAVATFEQGDYTIEKALDDDPVTGWAVYEGRPVDRDHEAVFYLDAPIAVPPGTKIVVELAHDSHHAQHHLGHFRISFSANSDVTLRSVQDRFAELLAIPTTERDEAQAAEIAEEFLNSDETYRGLDRKMRRTADKLKRLDDAAPKVMVMADRAERRKTFILDKGLYNQPRDEVKAGLPPIILKPKEDLPPNRLALAQWLVDPKHPLTARVTVNRIWAQIFGQGIVRTTENFGVQGEQPSHPELLDWLAVTFIESGWDVKALVRTIVSSTTYRQSSRVESEHLVIDPENRLLARSPRYRLPSWMIRDQALFTSGLLVSKMGGPAVKPYQPEGIWKEFSFGKKEYKRDSGDALYRRSLYTYWRRIVAPPMFFDAASRQTCSVNATLTNTPLHALATLNDTAYVEAGRAMAIALLRMPNATHAERIHAAYERVLARRATPDELAVLQQSINRLREEFGKNRELARAYLSVGELEYLEDVDLVEQAAYASLCLAILNTDEALNRE